MGWSCGGREGRPTAAHPLRFVVYKEEQFWAPLHLFWNNLKLTVHLNPGTEAGEEKPWIKHVTTFYCNCLSTATLHILQMYNTE